MPTGAVCDLRDALFVNAVLVLPNGSTMYAKDISADNVTNAIYVRLLADRELTTEGNYSILFNVKLVDGVMYSTVAVNFANVTTNADAEYKEIVLSSNLEVTDNPHNVQRTGASPKVSPRQTWLVYNDEAKAYEDTGITAEVNLVDYYTKEETDGKTAKLESQLTELKSELRIKYERSYTATSYNLLPISCKKGDSLKVSVEIANYQDTRVFITYNGENTKRLIDTASNADFINGEVEVICPSDISVLGVYCNPSVAYTLKVTQYGYVYDNIYKLNQMIAETDTKIAELSVETMSLQNPQLIDVTHLFYRNGLFAVNLDNGVFMPTENESGRYCAVFKTKVGDKFEIFNLKGASSAKAWLKYDKKGNILSSAPANITINDTLVMEHNGYIAFNHYGISSDIFSVKTNAEIIPLNAIVGLENLRKDLRIVKSEIPQVANNFGWDTSAAISQSFFTKVLYPLVQNDLTKQSVAGYMATTIGDVPSIVSHTSRRHIILDVQKGDAFLYDATGGSAGRAIAYVKDGIVTYVSVEGVIKAEFVADGSYDQVIFNYDSSFPATIVKLSETPKPEDKPLNEKNIIIFGDSSTDGSATSGTNWFNRMCKELGAANYRNYAMGGQTILNREDSTTNYLKKSIENAIANINAQWGGNVDVIMLQIGGNDMVYLSQIGTAEAAFSSYNYLAYKDDKTIYGSLRYCLELLRRTYPQALITMGTVFGRMGGDFDGNAQKINDVIKTCCNAMKIQVIDGGTYMGFSPFTEISVPYYNDGNPNVANDRSVLSRENPAYNFINDATGEIVTYDVATDGGVLKSGYSKRYGLYTYDGKHQTKEGEDKVMKFMSSEIKRLVI